jgi:hypothetical protein
MNMFWNRKLSSEWGSGAVVHMLRAATIAAVVSSCSTSPPRAVLAEAEEPPTPPLVMRLDPASSSAEASLVDAIKNYALNAYRELSTEEKSAAQNIITNKNQLLIVHVTISYRDSNGEERLLSLAETVPNPNNTSWNADLGTLRIPILPGPGTFRENFVNDVSCSDTGSPVTNTQCRRSGGAQYSCSF